MVDRQRSRKNIALGIIGAVIAVAVYGLFGWMMYRTARALSRDSAEPGTAERIIGQESPEGLGISDADAENLIGLWYGVDGSLLSLFADGSAEYWFLGWDTTDRGGRWGCADRTLYWDSPGVGITVYARLPEDWTGEMVLRSERMDWKAERYEKIDDEPVHLQVDSAIRLVGERLAGGTVEDAADHRERPDREGYDEASNFTLTIGGMNFSVPSYYQKYDDLSLADMTYLAEVYAVAGDDQAYIWFYQIPYSGEDWETISNRVADSVKHSVGDISFVSEDSFLIDGTPGKRLLFVDSIGEAETICTVNGYGTYLVAALLEQDMRSDYNEYDYKSDFERMMRSATNVR